MLRSKGENEVRLGSYRERRTVALTGSPGDTLLNRILARPLQAVTGSRHGREIIAREGPDDHIILEGVRAEGGRARPYRGSSWEKECDVTTKFGGKCGRLAAREGKE
jgi:hypothetical protein